MPRLARVLNVGRHMCFAESVNAYEPGSLIDDRYLLLRRLAEGGMSWVWLARHQSLDALVAVKIAKPGCSGADAEPSREARIAARLRHPAVVTVFDGGCTRWGDHFLVMEYLSGSPLSEVLDREGRLAPATAVELLLPILDALRHCHDHGVVHRDVKPANIVVGRQGGRTHAKLLDFGVAKPICVATVVPEMTGTPGYMAPEQVHGLAKTDQRADIWAVCSVIYECIAGRPAIEGDTYGKLLLATTELEVAPLDENEELASLWEILERGLRKDPAERFQSVDELRACLARWLDEDRGAARGLRGGPSGRVDPRPHGGPGCVRRHWTPLASETRPVMDAAPAQHAGDTLALENPGSVWAA